MSKRTYDSPWNVFFAGLGGALVMLALMSLVRENFGSAAFCLLAALLNFALAWPDEPQRDQR